MNRSLFYLLIFLMWPGLVHGEDFVDRLRKRKVLEPQISKQEAKLEECRQGKRTHQQCYVLLQGLISAYRVLGDTETANAYKKEAEALKIKHKDLSPSADTIARMKHAVRDYEKKFKEYQKGKRNHRDAHLILKMLQSFHWALQESKKARKYKAQLKNLEAKHSDLITDPPQELNDVRAKRLEQKKRLEELKRKPFKPKDTRAVVWRFKNQVVLKFQYRIEFYKESKITDIWIEKYRGIQKFQRSKIRVPRLGVGKVKFVKNGMKQRVKPRRILTFKHLIAVRPLEISKDQKAFLICTDLIHGYAACDEAERKIMSAKFGRDYNYDWQKPHADFDQFYGIVSRDGEILGRIPFKGTVPDSLLIPLEISTDGKKAVCAIGKRFFDPGMDYSSSVGDIQEIIIWEYPDKIRRVSVKEQTEEMKSIRKRHSRYDWEGNRTKRANLQSQ